MTTDAATTPASSDDLATDIGWLLGQAIHGYGRMARDAIGTFPGGIRGLHILGEAVGDRARNQLEVAKRLGVDRTVMVRLIDDLEREGLVERRPDPADRRARIVTPTDEGRRRLAETTSSLRAAEDLVMSPLEPGQRAAFIESLRTVVVHLLASDPAHGAGACDSDPIAGSNSPC